jgi:hypothetical protein
MGTFQGTVRLALPEDAASIAGNVKACYGPTHPVPACSTPRLVARAIAERRVVYALAVDPTGEVVGQAALDPADSPGLVELGRAIVRDAWRDAGVFSLLGRKLLAEAVPALGARFVLGRVVTSHTMAQRFGRPNGLVTVGLLLGMFPAGIRASGIAPTREPISAVLHARYVGAVPAPRRLTLEGLDRELAERALEALGVGTTRGPRAPASPLGVRVTRDDHFGVVRLRLAPGGETPLSADLVAHLESAPARLLWADVPAEHPDAARAAEALRELGFGFAAYVPGAGVSGEDVLRLQRYLGSVPLDPDAVHVLEDAEPFKEAVFAQVQRLEPALS